VDARVPNMLEGFEEYRVVDRDHHVGTSRIDLLLAEPSYLLEVKSCTLVGHGIAMFPDAPTTRGARHVEKLTRFVDEGGRAGVMFVVQREDARSFSPNTSDVP